MPRQPRSIVGGLVYHVLNRANARARLFADSSDYAAFESVLVEAHRRYPVPLLTYCVLPNHWHLVLWPQVGDEARLSRFMAWLTTTHTHRWHAHHGTAGTGHIYQDRFKSIPFERDENVLMLCRYVERNPVRAGLVQSAENWRWSGLWRRLHGSAQEQGLLSDWPIAIPDNWLVRVNQPETAADLEACRRGTK